MRHHVLTKNWKPGKLRRLMIVIAVILIMYLLIHVLVYALGDRFSYTLDRLDCSQTAIETRNKTFDTASDGCVIDVTVTNVSKNSATLDWYGIGGGPGSPGPLVHIFSKSGTYCDGGVAALQGKADISFESLAPHHSQAVTLFCMKAISDKPGGHYDTRSDESPAYLTFRGDSSTTTLVLSR